MDIRPEPRDRRLAELLSELTDETSTLVRQEIALARAEMGEKIDEAKKASMSLAMGGAVAYAGFLVLLACAVVGLSYVISPWLAALIVGGIVTLVGVIMLAGGAEKLKKQHLAPERTIEEARITRHMLKDELS